MGYGIVTRGAKSYFFRIGAVEQYFASSSKPAQLLTQEGRLAEISARRNRVERDLRHVIYQVFCVAFKKRERESQILAKINPTRRASLAACSAELLLSGGESPLYFDELKTVILGHWDKFANILDIDKSEFEYHMSVINQTRLDAHSKDVTDEQLEKWRVSINEITKRVAS